MSKWHSFDEKLPPYDEEILIELEGCKICKYLRTYLREGEGLGSYKKWALIKDLENKTTLGKFTHE